MQAAVQTLFTLALVWGLPVYILDRRARLNGRPTWMRFAIAFFMLFYFFIVPVFMALSLAGPKPPRRSRRRVGSGPASRPYTTHEPHYDPGAFRATAEPRTPQQPTRAPQRPREPSRHSQTGTILTPQQRREQFDLAQDKRRREQEQREAQQRRDTEQRAAERQAQALQARREHQEQAARDKQERQARADRARQAQDDLFMTWDERAEQERE